MPTHAELVRRYRLLLYVLPRRIRRNHGPDMEAAFAARLARVEDDPDGIKTRAVCKLERQDVLATAVRTRVDSAFRMLRGDPYRALRSPLERRHRSGGRGVTGVLGSVRDDVTYAARSLLRNPRSTILAAITLAVGIGTATLIFSALDGIVLRPYRFADAHRIVYVGSVSQDGGWAPRVRAEQLAAWRAQTDLVEAIELFSGTTMILTGGDNPRNAQIGRLSAQGFEFVGVQPSLGRGFTPEEAQVGGPRVLLLSHSLWQAEFGGRDDVLGETVQLDGVPWTIIGVMPAHYRQPGVGNEPDAIAPFLASDPGFPVALAKLRPGVTAARLQARMDDIAGPAGRDPANPMAGFTEGLDAALRRNFGDPLTVLSLAGAMMMLIACVNVSLLLLGRGQVRSHENTVRAALGAGRLRLSRQLLVESLMLAAVGAILGALLAGGGIRLLTSLRPPQLGIFENLSLNTAVLGFCAGLSVLSTLLFGMWPAVEASRPGLREALGNPRSLAGRRRSGFARSGLVTSQVALALALLVISGALAQSALARQTFDPGFDPEGLTAAYLRLPAFRYPDSTTRLGVLEQLAERLAAAPGGLRASFVEGSVAGRTYATVFDEGREDAPVRLVGHAVGFDYFRTVGLTVLEGRAFTDGEIRAGAPVAMVSRGAADEHLAGDAGVGRRLRIGNGEWHTIIGVVGDAIAPSAIAGGREIDIYVPYRGGEGPFAFASLLLRAGAPTPVEAMVRRELRTVTPEAPLLEVASMPQSLRAPLAMDRFIASLSTLFAVVAVVLAGIGLYGVLVQAVASRRREVGIRVSLGATPPMIRNMLLRHTAALTVLGLFAGGLLAIAGSRALGSALFTVQPGDWRVFFAAASVIALMVSVATYVPARRAAAIDPIVALRSE